MTIRRVLVLCVFAWGWGCGGPDEVEIASELAESRQTQEVLSRILASLEADLKQLNSQRPCLPPQAPAKAGERAPIRRWIQTDPPDATVFVEGRKVGRAPLEIVAPADVFSIRVEKDDHWTERRTIDLRQPGNETIVIGLRRIGAN